MRALSTVIITYNEEKNIERCLLSVLDISDEVIVLDSFSTDATKDICNKYKVKFFQHAFDGHIEQKNRVVEMAKYNYVLSVDADEVLSGELIKSIQKVKENFNSDSYFFNRQNFFCGKKIKFSGWYPDRKIRLWNKNKAKWGGVNPHDTVILEKNTTKEYLTGDLLHYSFTSINQHINQINKFSDIKAQNDFYKNKKANLFKILFKPSFKFFKTYFIKLGFLDGFYGIVIAYNSAHSEFLRQVKLKELYLKNGK